MIVTIYEDAASFLQEARYYLEQNEALNGLMLGLAFRLEQFADRIKVPPLLATVSDDDNLVATAVMTPPHKLIVYSDQPEPDAALTALAHHLRSTDWSVPAVLGLAPVAEAFANLT
jgi:hypothetical protein